MEETGMISGINYSTQSEKDMELKSVKYAYEIRDKALQHARYQAASLSLVLLLSILTLRDSFSCTGSFEECDQVRSALSCKA